LAQAPLPYQTVNRMGKNFFDMMVSCSGFNRIHQYIIVIVNGVYYFITHGVKSLLASLLCNYLRSFQYRFNLCFDAVTG
jgi:hypothetical protein